MTKQENELNNYLLEQGWKEGAASPERVSRLLDRLSVRNKLAAVAIADTEFVDIEDIELEAAA